MYFFLIFKFLTILSLHFSVFVKLPPPPHFGHQILLRTLTDAITKWMYTWKKKPGTSCLHSIFITQLTSAIVNTDFDLVQHKVVSTVPQIGLYIGFFFLITSSQMKARWHQCLANIIRYFRPIYATLKKKHAITGNETHNSLQNYNTQQSCLQILVYITKHDEQIDFIRCT